MNNDCKDLLIATGVIAVCSAGFLYISHLHDKAMDKKRVAKMIAHAHKVAKEITEGELSNAGRIKVEMHVAGAMLGISLAYITEFRDQDMRKAAVEEAREILNAAIAERFPY